MPHHPRITLHPSKLTAAKAFLRYILLRAVMPSLVNRYIRNSRLSKPKSICGAKLWRLLLPVFLVSYVLNSYVPKITNTSTRPISQNPTSACYHQLDRSYSETFCLHSPLYIPRPNRHPPITLQPTFPQNTSMKCRSLSGALLLSTDNNKINCHEGFSKKHPKETAFLPPILNQHRDGRGSWLVIKGTTMILPMASIDANIAHAAMRLFFAYGILHMRWLLDNRGGVKRILVIASKGQGGKIWMDERTWQGGALRLLFGDVGFIVVGKGDERKWRWRKRRGIWEELLVGLGGGVYGIMGSRKVDGVWFECVVVVGSLDVRLSIPDVSKGIGGDRKVEGKGLLAGEMVGLYQKMFKENNEMVKREGARSIVYVRRSKKNVRRSFKSAKNENMLIKALERAGNVYCVRLRILDDHKMCSFKEQVRLMKEADVIVGVHGAGLTNAVWARPNSTLVEIMPYKYNHAMYSTVVQSGVRYRKVWISRGKEYTEKHLTHGECMGDWKCSDFYKDQDIDMDRDSIDQIEREVKDGLAWARNARVEP